MRRTALIAVLLLAGCGSPPPPAKAVDPTTEAWYGRTVEDLAAANREAEADLAAGKRDEAAAAIVRGQGMEQRLLSVSRPTLAAEEAVSDLERLYGRMLLSNRHYGWARLAFQKNLARWRHWVPETPETIRRRQQAEGDIADCDRRMTE
jgi:hypothetical protein